MTNIEKLYYLMKKLTYKAFRLYMMMLNEQLDDYQERYISLFGVSKDTYQNARKELIEKGFIK